MNPGNLTALHDMALFVEVGRTLSFRKAGQNLSIPAATLSRRISALEETLGVALFQRSTRVVTLTEIGQHQFERCSQLVDQAMHVMDEFSEAANEPTGHLRISMPVDLGVRFIGPLIPGFREIYPNITLDIDLDASNKNLFVDGVDIAIRLELKRKNNNKALSIGTIAMGLYASTSYLNSTSKLTKPESLTNHNCLLMQGKKRSEVWKLIAIKNGSVENITVKGNYKCNNLGLTTFFAEQGFGIAKLAAPIVEKSVREGTLQPVLPDWELAPLNINFITPTAVSTASVIAFRDYISNKLSYRL